MVVFWVVAALLLAGALLLLLPHLWSPRGDGVSARGANLAVHRDQLREAERDVAQGLLAPERLEQARDDIRQRVLEDAGEAQHRPGAATAARPARGTALALALLVPLGAVMTYLHLGRPDAVAPADVAGPATGQAASVEALELRATALAERLRGQTGDAQGWVTLSRSYTALGRYRDAALALRRAAELLPPNASLLADLADLTGMAQGKRLSGEPARLIQQALGMDPRHAKALALAGSAAFETSDFAAARAYWQRLLDVLAPDAPIARSIQGSIAEATRLESAGAQRGAALMPAGPAPAQAAAATAATAPGAVARAGAAAVSGQVIISAELASRVAPGDTLFVFARAVEGPRMPLAVLRRPTTGGAQRFDFTLDDSMAMSPATRLSAFDRVVVSARISHSGEATVRSGDLIGNAAEAKPGAQGLRIVVDRVQP